MNEPCKVCGFECDGSLMRTNPRFTRARDLVLDPATPRRDDGGLAICHLCQRGIFFAGGLIPFLQKRIKRLAIEAACKRGSQTCPECGGSSFYHITTRNLLKCISCAHQFPNGKMRKAAKITDAKYAEVRAAILATNAYQASMACGVSYKTAWQIASEVRDACHLDQRF